MKNIEVLILVAGILAAIFAAIMLIINIGKDKKPRGIIQEILFGVVLVAIIIVSYKPVTPGMMSSINTVWLSAAMFAMFAVMHS